MKSRLHLGTCFGIALQSLLLACLMPVRVGAQAPPAVPAEYQDLYSLIQGDLDAFNATLTGLGGGAKYPVLQTGELTIANATNGPQLVSSGFFTGVQTQVASLKAMGIQAIAVRVDFPMLYQPFFSSQSDYQQYVSFYSQVSSSIKAAGMKIIVENTCMASSGDLAGWALQLLPFYLSLDWPSYQAARAQTAQVIAQTIQPDYIVIAEEPDNEAQYCLQPNANTVSGSTGMVDQIHTSVLAASVPGLQVGAGVGTWLPAFQTFINGYAGYQCSSTQPCVTIPLDFVDMHIYPVNNILPPTSQNMLANALTIAQTAAAAGKPVTISETWDWKVRDSELGILTADQVQCRNAFDFWEPLDAYFLQTMQSFANYAHMPFLVPFPSQDFSTYLPWTLLLDIETPQQIYNTWFGAATTAMNAATYSPTGMSYYASNVTTPDTTPPTPPTNVIGAAGSTSTINLTWNAATDNVGVAGYYVSRNGAPPVATALTTYQDTGLTGSTSYTYTLQAFDLAGNLSTPPVTVTANTQDNTAPTAPASVTATATAPQQVTLAWSPGTDDVAVGGYHVFQGTSPAALNLLIGVAAATTSLPIASLTPSTTYYFGVETVDTSGNLSPMSPVVSVTTPALPSAPTSVTATPSSASIINLTWMPGPSGMPLTGYYLFRGSSPSTLSKIASVAGASFNDTGLTASTTYYYAVEEVDTVNDVSPMSATVSATTMAGPASPINLTTTPTSTTQIKLTWSPGSGGTRAASYQVFLGTSPSSLSQITSLTAMTYGIQGLTPSTTYYFGVSATDSQGNVSPMSAVVSATTLALPSPPINVTATALSTSQISVTWTAGPSGMPVVSYYVFGGSSPSTLSKLATVASTTTSYTNKSLSPSTTYYYGVEEVDKAGNVSPMSATVSATTLVGASAPSNLTATPTSTSQISLTWSAPSGNTPISKYYVFQGSSPTTLNKIGTPTGTSFNNGGLTPSTTYYYGVEAVDTLGNISPMSAVVSATTLALPSAPTNVAATAVSTSQINVTWTPGPSGMPLSCYYLFRGTSPSTLSKLGTVTGTSYSDKTLSASTTYYYALQEVDTGGNVSPMSATVSATTLGGPSTPGNLTATPTSTSQISLTWSASSGGSQIACYLVFRGTSPTNLSQLATPTGLSYTDHSLTPSTTYYYAVQAKDTSSNLSPLSPTVAATTLALPSAPTNLTATAVGKTQISLTWSAAPSGMPLSSYKIYSGSTPSNLTLLATVPATKLSYTNYPVTAGTTYYYAVQAADTGGNVSPYSNTASVTTPQ